MEKKYKNLDRLVEQDTEARAYYDSLPDYVREQIATRSDSVNSLSSLRDYAENLLRGD